VVNVTTRPLFTPVKNPVAIVQFAGWAPGPVWTDVENIDPTGIQSSDRPAHSQSLYRLSYPALNVCSRLLEIFRKKILPTSSEQKYFIMGTVFERGFHRMDILFIKIYIYIYTQCVKGKGKAIPLEAWRDPKGSKRLSLPDFKTIGT
jgi:hypothetical protein